MGYELPKPRNFAAGESTKVMVHPCISVHLNDKKSINALKSDKKYKIRISENPNITNLDKNGYVNCRTRASFLDCLSTAEYYPSKLTVKEFIKIQINSDKLELSDQDGTLKDPSILSKTKNNTPFGADGEKNRQVLLQEGFTIDQAPNIEVNPGDILVIGETVEPKVIYKGDTKGGYAYHAECVYAVERDSNGSISNIFTMYQLASDHDVDYSDPDILYEPKYGQYKGVAGFFNYWNHKEKGSFKEEQKVRCLVLVSKIYTPEYSNISDLCTPDPLFKLKSEVPSTHRELRGMNGSNQKSTSFVQQEIQRINGIEKAKFQNKKEDRLPIIEEQPKTKDKKKKTVRFSDDVAVKYVARYIRDMEEAEQAKNKVSISSLSLASSEDRPLRRSSRLNPSQIVSSAHEPQELEKEKSLPSKKAKNKVSISSLSLASSEDRPLRRSSRLNPSQTVLSTHEIQEVKKEKLSETSKKAKGKRIDSTKGLNLMTVSKKQESLVKEQDKENQPPQVFIGKHSLRKGTETYYGPLAFK
ncbi:hypothetical protein L3V86_07485 [Thiotrichales bacterium 19S11-10]|nr:hypothetical protein [Thiotrichales bacterium 19S11-10]